MKHKEVHERIPKDQVNVLDYKPLINKVLQSLAKTYGQYVYDYDEELKQDGIIALLKAKEDYDPTRGTYVTLAWLRIRTFMHRRLIKESEQYANTCYLEDLALPSDSSEPLIWEDLLPSNQVDFAAVARLACTDSLDWKILEGLTEEGVNPRQLHQFIGLPFNITQARVAQLKDNMAEVVKDIYSAPEKCL